MIRFVQVCEKQLSLMKLSHLICEKQKMNENR